MKHSLIKQALIRAMETMDHHEDDIETVNAKVVKAAPTVEWLEVEFTFTDGSSTIVI